MELKYENGKPVLKMETDGVKMTFIFAIVEPKENAKERILDILTSQHREHLFDQLKSKA